MNDFDSIIGEAIGQRADSAPSDRPDFGEVLSARQQRLRRRSAMSALGILAIGATGMAAFAVGGPADSTADGPDTPIGSDGQFATTIPGGPVATVPAETVWYCEGALDQGVVNPTTTIAPATTIAVDPPESDPVPDATHVAALEDSGFFRSCFLVEGGAIAPAEPDVTVVIPGETFPTTTLLAPTAGVSRQEGTYVVQPGDSPSLIADKFDLRLDDLLTFNGWVDGSEFPFPGQEIGIPPQAGRPYVVQEGDYLIKIANDACVVLADILELNDWTTGNELGLPGQVVQLPASPADGTCPDNGPSD